MSVAGEAVERATGEFFFFFFKLFYLLLFFFKKAKFKESSAEKTFLGQRGDVVRLRMFHMVLGLPGWWSVMQPDDMVVEWWWVIAMASQLKSRA